MLKTTDGAKRSIDTTYIGIGFLSVTAALLLAANMVITSARADTVAGNRDYTATTARLASGGEALYILNNDSGQMVVFNYDPSTRSMVQRTKALSLPDLFQPGQ